MSSGLCPQCGGNRFENGHCKECGFDSKENAIVKPEQDGPSAALKKCPDCGAVMSREAYKCPNCGRQMKQTMQDSYKGGEKSSSPVGIFVAVVLGIVVAVWIISKLFQVEITGTITPIK